MRGGVRDGRVLLRRRAHRSRARQRCDPRRDDGASSRGSGPPHANIRRHRHRRGTREHRFLKGLMALGTDRSRHARPVDCRLPSGSADRRSSRRNSHKPISAPTATRTPKLVISKPSMRYSTGYIYLTSEPPIRCPRWRPNTIASTQSPRRPQWSWPSSRPFPFRRLRQRGCLA